jgi:hypothetical protein
MPGPHQVPATVLTGTDQVPGRLLRHGRDRDRGDLVQAQQAGQVHRVPGVGLDPVPSRALQNLEGAATSHRIPAAVNARHNPNPVGPAS